MSRRRRHKGKAQPKLKITIVPSGQPVAAVLKASFLRDLMLNVDYIAEYAENYNLTPSDAIDDLFTMMRADGYVISRDADTILFREDGVVDESSPQETDVELNIRRSASIAQARKEAILKTNKIIEETNSGVEWDDNEGEERDRDQPPLVVDGQVVLPGD